MRIIQESPMHRFTHGFAAFVCLAFVCSCTPQNAPAPPTAKVSGKVTLDGQPMESGTIRFVVPSQPPKSMEIKSGAFSGEAFTGKNKVEVVKEVDGPPSTTDPKIITKINEVSTRFSGPTSKLSAEVPASGATDLKFEVTKD